MWGNVSYEAWGSGYNKTLGLCRAWVGCGYKALGLCRAWVCDISVWEVGAEYREWSKQTVPSPTTAPLTPFVNFLQYEAHAWAGAHLFSKMKSQQLGTHVPICLHNTCRPGIGLCCVASLLICLRWALSLRGPLSRDSSELSES